MSFLDWFKRKKKKQNIAEEQETQPAVLQDTVSIGNHVVTLCEQMIDLLYSLDEIKRDYDTVTAYLNDIQLVEGVMGEQKTQIVDTAMNISKLAAARNKCLNTEQKISDAVFNQMQNEEAEMPRIIKRLKENEENLDAIKRDMNRLSAEKMEWSVRRTEAQNKQRMIRVLSKVMLVIEGILAVLVMAFSLYLKSDNTLGIAIVALIATGTAVTLIVNSQECTKELKRCDINQNHVISLENHVKIKFVNMKNAVDYCCQRYRVKNSYELTYNYEKFIEITREREKLKEVNADLEYYGDKLVGLLQKLNLYEAKVWVSYADALVDPREMVEVRHRLFLRRQKLREQIEYNMTEVTKMRAEVESYYDMNAHREQLERRLSEANGVSEEVGIFTEGMNRQIQEVLDRVDEVHRGFM
uniref:hypothetical protein n=1 Tax=Agathobacter sp. TaxID=2021311 RepID=UPI00405669C4